MVKYISINNFKSIPKLAFETKRINLFIGDPNSGKSNILEALSLFSVAHLENIGTVIRLRKLIDIFTDNNIYDPVVVTADEDSVSVVFDRSSPELVFKLGEKEYIFRTTQAGKIDNWFQNNQDVSKIFFEEQPLKFKPYHFSVTNTFKERNLYFLFPPKGDNLPEILRTNLKTREVAANIFKSRGYKLNLNVERMEINMLKEIDDVVYTYPYKSISDTLQRITFYLAALESNKDSVLIFEEPEANTFPYYTKFLAERIALDENKNQFFIATHNPYLLMSIVEKTTFKDLTVNLTYLEGHQTCMHQLSDEQLSELLDLESDVFFNLDKFLPSQE